MLGLDKLKEIAGNVTNYITINAAPGMDERALAQEVAQQIQFRADAEGAVWA